MTFQQVIDKYRKIAFSEHDKGSRFERLMQAYLKTDPKYAYLFKNVWLWDEFPGKVDLGGSADLTSEYRFPYSFVSA